MKILFFVDNIDNTKENIGCYNPDEHSNSDELIGKIANKIKSWFYPMYQTDNYTNLAKILVESGSGTFGGYDFGIEDVDSI